MASQLHKPEANSLGTVLVADVGNTKIKLAVAGMSPAVKMPMLSHHADLCSHSFRSEDLEAWLEKVPPGSDSFLIASVHDAAATRLESTIGKLSATLQQQRIVYHDLPLQMDLENPDSVGIDRVASAAAANYFRHHLHAAIIVDCGTAITVDLVSEKGVFCGGSIFPGPFLMAQSLAAGTSRLPDIFGIERSCPPALPGRSTKEAIAAGIGWGIRGAVTTLVEEARKSLDVQADLFLTGGCRWSVIDCLPHAIEIPDLVLMGVSLTKFVKRTV